MKFTKKAFRDAVRRSDRTLVWHLAAIRLGHTPTKDEVYDLIHCCCTVRKQRRLANWLTYLNTDEAKRAQADNDAFVRRGGYAQYGTAHYRQVALKMLRRLATEPLSGYTKVPMFGHTHLYFTSPVYGHADYNKVRTCLLNGPLATDGNDPQAAWCAKVLDLGNRIFKRKTENEREVNLLIGYTYGPSLCKKVVAGLNRIFRKSCDPTDFVRAIYTKLTYKVRLVGKACTVKSLLAKPDVSRLVGMLEPVAPACRGSLG